MWKHVQPIYIFIWFSYESDEYYLSLWHKEIIMSLKVWSKGAPQEHAQSATPGSI